MYLFNVKYHKEKQAPAIKIITKGIDNKKSLPRKSRPIMIDVEAKIIVKDKDAPSE